MPFGMQSLEPTAPQSLTQGLPDPGAISTQRTAYTRALEKQLQEGSTVLSQQLKQQTEYLHQVGDQQKRQYSLEVDQQMKSQEIQLVQQHNQQLLMLQQAAQQQKAALEQQANALLLDYNQKKATEDLAFQQFQFQSDQYEAQLKYSAEMKSLQEQALAAQNQVQQQQAAIAQQAMAATQQASMAQQQALNTSTGYFPSSVSQVQNFSSSTTQSLPAPVTFTTEGMQSYSYRPPMTSFPAAQMAPTMMVG